MQILQHPRSKHRHRNEGGGDRERICCQLLLSPLTLRPHPLQRGEGQSPDAAAETGQENIQVNFIEEQGDWVMVLRRKSKQKLPKTTFLYWNKEMRGNFKAWGDPYKCISTDQNFPVPVAAPLPAVAAPALPPPFVPP